MRSDEPKVKTEMVSVLVRAALDREDGMKSEDAIAIIAAKCSVSPRTVYRVLEIRKPTMRLALADAMLLAIGQHLQPTMLTWTD